MVYPDSLKSRDKLLAFRVLVDSDGVMIRDGFLSKEDRGTLIGLARDGSAASRVTRRANALVLLDNGWSCQEVAAALLLNDDTIRNWYKLFEQRGIEGLTSFDMGGSAGFLSTAQEDALKAFVSATLPRSTRQVGAFIEREFGLVYESRSGLIALLHRLGLEYHKPNVIARKLDVAKLQAFIESYDKLLNSLGNDEAVLFVDAVHPTHAARPVGCWAQKQEKLAIEQTSGRERINIHGAIDLETGQTRMIDVETVNAASTITLLEAIEALYPMLALIHVFLDNARYHHAKLVQDWLARPECRIKLHFIPSYCPHLNPIERLWGLMHRNVTHNKTYATCAQFADAAIGFLRDKVPRNWAEFCDSVTDNFRVIDPNEFRVVT
jgi:transposase